MFTGGDQAGARYDNLLVTSLAQPEAVPEPATLALLGLAACGLSGYVRRRRTR